MLAVGIALGALIGSGPTDSLASSSRAAELGRVLALLALGSGTGSGGNLALSSGAANPPATTPQPTPSTTSEATSGSGEASGGAASTSSTPSHSSTSSPSPRTTSPTSSTTPAAGREEKEESEKTAKTKPLPPIADAWVIELPYGSSLENALKQSAAAPYLDGQLKGAGTALSGYSSLAAAQLAGAATLLSGQVGASVNTIAPPPCTSAAAGATPGTTSGSAAATPASSTSQPGAACPSGEPAGVQAADAYLQEVVPKIEASTAYKEHGLIVITFGGQQGASSGTTTNPSASSTDGTGTEVIYPAGSITSTLTAAGAPAGALLLSPFLSHAGARSASAFNPLAPHESLEALFRAKATS